jgi:hypothetical protein
VENARQLALHVVMAAVPRFGRDRDQAVFEDRFAVGLDRVPARQQRQK